MKTSKPSPSLSDDAVFVGRIRAAAILDCNPQLVHLNRKDVIFVFKDPLAVGEELQRRYNAGVFPLVHAKMLAQTRGFLADESARVKGAARAEKS